MRPIGADTINLYRESIVHKAGYWPTTNSNPTQASVTAGQCEFAADDWFMMSVQFGDKGIRFGEGNRDDL